MNDNYKQLHLKEVAKIIDLKTLTDEETDTLVWLVQKEYYVPANQHTYQFPASGVKYNGEKLDALIKYLTEAKKNKETIRVCGYPSEEDDSLPFEGGVMLQLVKMRSDAEIAEIALKELKSIQETRKRDRAEQAKREQEKLKKNAEIKNVIEKIKTEDISVEEASALLEELRK